MAMLNRHVTDDPERDDEEPPDEESREPEAEPEEREEPEEPSSYLRSEPVEGPMSDPLWEEDQAGEPDAPLDRLRAHSEEPDSEVTPNSELSTRNRCGSVVIVPPPFDPAKARPRAVVYIHLSEAALTAGRGVARVEDLGPVLMTRLRQLLGDYCQILLKPVIDLNNAPPPVDSYEIPDKIAEHVRLRQPVDVFPFASCPSRHSELDHSVLYLPVDKGGPPGQTRVEGLGPLASYSHRVRTHGRWRLRRPDALTWLWRSPYGRLFLVNATGTHPLGHSPWTKQIWRAAKAPPFDKLREQSGDKLGEHRYELAQPGDGLRAQPNGTSRVETVVRGLLDANIRAG